MIIEITREEAIERIEKISKYIVKKKMAAPAIMTIESLRPLNFIGSQFMYFLAPFAEFFFNEKEYEEFAALLGKDEYVRLLVKRIDELDEAMNHEERKKRRILRKRKINKIKNFFSSKRKN